MLAFHLGAHVLHVYGKIDAANSDELGAMLEWAVGGASFTLDMTKVEFIDSAGLRELLRASRRPGVPGPLRIIASATVYRIFQLTGMDARPEIELRRANELTAAEESSWARSHGPWASETS